MKNADKAMVFSYIISGLLEGDGKKSPLAIQFNGKTIATRGSNIVVSKTTEEESFPLEDPECVNKILDYIKKPEGHYVRLCMDDYFIAISVDKLVEIIKPYVTSTPCVNTNFGKYYDYDCVCPEYDKVYDQIWDTGQAYESWTSQDNMDYWVTNYSQKEFETFVEEFLGNDFCEEIPA